MIREDQGCHDLAIDQPIAAWTPGNRLFDEDMPDRKIVWIENWSDADSIESAVS